MTLSGREKWTHHGRICEITNTQGTEHNNDRVLVDRTEKREISVNIEMLKLMKLL